MTRYSILLMFYIFSFQASAQDEKSIWENAGFRNPEIVILQTSADRFSNKYTHELSMSLVMLRYSGNIVETVGYVDESGDQIVVRQMDIKVSGWSKEVTVKSMVRVAEIYSQCGIKIDNVKLVIVDAPKDLTNVETYRQMLARAPQISHPAVFLTRERLEEDAAGHAYRYAMTDVNDVARDTAWVAGLVNTDYHKKLKQEGFSTLAHELAHLVADAEHIDYENGMNLLGPSSEQQNSEIWPSQCEEMKKHPSVKEISTRNPANVQLTESEFNSAIDEVTETLRPAIESHNGKLVVEKFWNSNKDDASADLRNNMWMFEVHGGLGRHPEMTRDVLQLVVCHELGHLLGGYPFGSYGGWDSSEGQADTFATQVCAPMVWAKQKETNKKFRAIADPYAKSMCDKSWKDTARQELCYRITAASLQNAIYLSDGDATEFALPGNPPLAFNTPDPTKPRDTITNKLYSAQCRLDSLFQGSLCDGKFDIFKIPGLGFPDGSNGIDAEKEAAKYSCTKVENNEVHLVRPRCWYVPRDLK